MSKSRHPNCPDKSWPAQFSHVLLGQTSELKSCFMVFLVWPGRYHCLAGTARGQIRLCRREAWAFRAFLEPGPKSPAVHFSGRAKLKFKARCSGCFPCSVKTRGWPCGNHWLQPNVASPGVAENVFPLKSSAYLQPKSKVTKEASKSEGCACATCRPRICRCSQASHLMCNAKLKS